MLNRNTTRHWIYKESRDEMSSEPAQIVNVNEKCLFSVLGTSFYPDIDQMYSTARHGCCCALIIMYLDPVALWCYKHNTRNRSLQFNSGTCIFLEKDTLQSMHQLTCNLPTYIQCVLFGGQERGVHCI